MLLNKISDKLVFNFLSKIDYGYLEIKTFDGERVMGLKNENEDILVKSYKIDEIKEKMHRGEFINGLTLVAIQWFFLNIDKY